MIKIKRLIKKAELMEVYHGTSSDALDSIMSSGLKVTIGGQGDGAYVTTDQNLARQYALKRAGDRLIASMRHRYSKFDGVYPVIVVVKIDSSELTQGYNTNMFAKAGISPDKIERTIDLSNDQTWQDLIKSLKLEDTDQEQSEELYRSYLQVVQSIV